MKKYRHIFFDLDHTLWDFDRNIEEVIHDLYTYYDLSRYSFSTKDFLSSFLEANTYLWLQFDMGLMNSSDLKNIRFKIIFTKLGIPSGHIPEDIRKKFEEFCSTKSHVIDHAHTILEFLSKDYKLHILTNGTVNIQNAKLESSGIIRYIDKLITSDISGCHKPEKQMFEYALKATNASKYDSIMIGDNLETDILGAQNADLDQVYFNPKKISHTENVTYEISSLDQLMDIF